MDLKPISKQMRFFARRVINLGSRRLLPGQELIPHRVTLSWRRIVLLYEQRRIITEADPYFEELMRIEGLRNNAMFAKEWLDRGDVEYEEVPLGADIEEDSPLAEETEIEIREAGGGWYDVFVDGDQVNDRRLRKRQALKLAEKYE